MPKGRPDRKDLLLPDTLQRLRIAAGFRHQVDFAKATGFDPTKKKRGGLHPETIGHYERGELCPGEGMALYIAQQLISKREPLADKKFMAAYEHDRPIWDAAEAAAKAADAAAEGDVAADDAATEEAIIRPTATEILDEPPLPQAARGADGRWHLIVLAEEPDDEDDAAAGANDITIIIPPPPRPPSRPIALLSQRRSSPGDASEEGSAVEVPEENKASTSGAPPEETEEEEPIAAVPISVPASPPVPAQPPTDVTSPPSTINRQPPPLTPRPPRARHRGPLAVRMVVAATAIAVILTLAIVVGQAHLPNRRPVLVATTTRAVTATSFLTPTHQVPTMTPTHAPMATPTLIATATATHAPSQASITWWLQRRTSCGWTISLESQHFQPGAFVQYSYDEATTIDCTTGAVTQQPAMAPTGDGYVAASGQIPMAAFIEDYYGTFHFTISDTAGDVVHFTVSYDLNTIPCPICNCC